MKAIHGKSAGGEPIPTPSWGEKFAFLVPTDLTAINAMSEVAANIFHKLGMNMDYQALDWATVAQRLLSQETLNKGG